MELRGFDSYPITLGDEMRGERASIGKSLRDAERDLRIKERMLVAIENCDLEGFPNRSVVAGYVRSYARYLGMDAEDCYRRFCEESGYQSPATLMAGREGGGARAVAGILPDRALGAELACSRFAAPPARSRFQARVSLGALTSAAALMGLIAGLSYGGYALLQDIQRVGFAPLPEAPAVVAEAPLITAPEEEAATVLPQPADYLDGGVLAAVAAPAHLQPIEQMRRDGPISAIDPRTAGVFVPVAVVEEVPADQIDSADDAIRAAALAATGEPAVPDGTPAGEIVAGALAAAAPVPKVTGIALHASEDAWIRVRERDSVIFEGILGAGQRFELPARSDAAVLKAGNAGGIFVFVDGVAYGPLGQRGHVVGNVSLAAEDIRERMPQAASAEIASAATAYLHQRAEAAAVRP